MNQENANTPADPNAILARVEASPARRLTGVATLLILGFLLVYIGVTHPPATIGWQLFLIGFGALVLFVADKMRRATMGALVLTREALNDEEGRVIARIDNIASVDRGTFAFKPSNGFILRLKTRAERRWMPGLWWRMGRRIGVGGVTAASQTKGMAEAIATIIALRDAD